MTNRFHRYFVALNGAFLLLFLSACTTESTDARYEFVGELSTSPTRNRSLLPPDIVCDVESSPTNS